MLTLCSRFAHVLLIFCSSFAQLRTDLLIVCSCEEQEEVLSRSIVSSAELQRDAVYVTDLAQLVCTVIKAQPQAAATAATGATATARKYTRSLPLRVIDRSSLTDSSACDNSRRRQHRHRS